MKTSVWFHFLSSVGVIHSYNSIPVYEQCNLGHDIIINFYTECLNVRQPDVLAPETKSQAIDFFVFLKNRRNNRNFN